MSHVARQLATVVALALVGACSGSPVAPTGQPRASAPESAAPPPAPLPPVPGARTFAFTSGTQASLTWYTPQSRYVLYDNGTFVLEYPHVSYRGTYKEDSGTITFGWEGWSTAGPWGATGALVGDQLTVRYNIVMMLSDFEDAVYKLQQP